MNFSFNLVTISGLPLLFLGVKWRDKSCNETSIETKVTHYEKLYCRQFHDILNYFRLNDVLMDICQLLRLLCCRKVVRYKVKIPIPNLWILKEGEVPVNEGCWVN